VPVFDTDRVCWADGAAVRHSKLLGAQVYQYKMNGVSCGSYNGPTGMMGYGSYCLSTATLPCDGGNDGGYPPSASYDNEFFTCADGTKVDIGPNLGTCAPLASLFGPISGCTSGSLAGCAYPP
jgi:hypothetical protein